MTRYREYYPSNKFRNIISCFWTIAFDSNQQLPDLDLVLPDGCTDLLINLGPSFTRLDKRGDKAFQVNEYALVGQRKHAIEVAQSSATQFFAIRFTPFGLKSIFPYDAAQLTGIMLGEDELIKRIVDPIRQVLEGKISFQDKLVAIESLLERSIMSEPDAIPCVENATIEILKSHGCFNVKAFCERNNIHKSTLEKHFLRRVGLSPKKLASIIRFNRAHALIKSKKDISLTHVALDCGYYDQSHMIKEFRQFANCSPSELYKANFLLPDIALTSHQSIRFSS